MKNTFVTIATYQYSSEAHIIKGRLEADGIEVLIWDNLTIDTDPLVSNAIGGVKLKVKIEDESKALEILDSISKNSIDNEGNPIHCINCNSKNVNMFSTVKNRKSLFWFIIGLLYTLLPFYAKFNYRCGDCGTEFDLK